MQPSQGRRRRQHGVVQQGQLEQARLQRHMCHSSGWVAQVAAASVCRHAVIAPVQLSILLPVLLVLVLQFLWYRLQHQLGAEHSSTKSCIVYATARFKSERAWPCAQPCWAGVRASTC